MVPSTGLSLIRAKWGRLKAVNRWGIPHDLENEIRDRDSRPRFATEMLRACIAVRHYLNLYQEDLLENK
jgi:hypothetical protein